MKDINIKIGQRIKELRESQNLSQKDLATEINSYQSTISQYEYGTKGIPVEHLVKLADYFNVSCQFLCTGEDSNNKLAMLKKYIHLKYCECPVDDSQQEYLVLSINKSLINYLYQVAQSEHIPNLPDKAREAWYQEMEKEFNSSYMHNQDSISFIPFPSENISTDNSPNKWHQQELLEKTTIFFKKTFS